MSGLGDFERTSVLQSRLGLPTAGLRRYFRCVILDEVSNMDQILCLSVLVLSISFRVYVVQKNVVIFSMRCIVPTTNKETTVDKRI